MLFFTDRPRGHRPSSLGECKFGTIPCSPRTISNGHKGQDIPFCRGSGAVEQVPDSIRIESPVYHTFDCANAVNFALYLV